jgi:hypothetical protein
VSIPKGKTQQGGKAKSEPDHAPEFVHYTIVYEEPDHAAQKETPLKGGA